MTASEYKAKIKRLLHAKKYAGVIEEVVNTWNADLIGVKWGGDVNEFEIKVSLVDLRGEVRAIKRALEDNIYQEITNQHSLWSHNVVKVEEKVSTTKLEKHYHYLVRDHKRSSNYTSENPEVSGFVPSRFYFALPQDLVAPAKLLLEGVPYYGILNADNGDFVKSARKLPRESIRPADMFNIFTRCGTELRQAESTAEYFSNLYKNGEYVHVKRKHVYTDYRGEEHISWY